MIVVNKQRTSLINMDHISCVYMGGRWLPQGKLRSRRRMPDRKIQYPRGGRNSISDAISRRGKQNEV